MKNQLIKMFCVCAMVLFSTHTFANTVKTKEPHSKTSYKKKNNFGFEVINHTRVNFVSVTISGLDSSNNPLTLTINDIPHNGSNYFYFDEGPIHSVSVTITTASPVVYAFDVWNASSRVYDIINYNGSPRTFYIPDNNNNELYIECYTEDW